MSIATKCTCHMSSNGFCNSTVKECTQFITSRYSEVVPGVVIGSITPEARQFLETIMDAWDKHYEGLKEANGKDYEPSYYGFAYWLVRWSGLVQPVISQNEK